jgi:hypothetical protein
MKDYLKQYFKSHLDQLVQGCNTDTSKFVHLHLVRIFELEDNIHKETIRDMKTVEFQNLCFIIRDELK